MKTENFEIELMIPSQIEKEVAFNEAICTLDSLCNIVVKKIIYEAPKSDGLSAKYLISGANNKDCICYRPAPGKSWRYLAPKEDMLIFVSELNSFYKYNKGNWRPVFLQSHDPTPLEHKFIGIEGNYGLTINSNVCYLYLINNCKLSFTKCSYDQFTLLVKQNVKAPCKLIWPENVIWPQKKAHVKSSVLNTLDVIRFYKLAEENKFLAKVVETDYVE